MNSRALLSVIFCSLFALHSAPVNSGFLDDLKKELEKVQKGLEGLKKPQEQPAQPAPEQSLPESSQPPPQPAAQTEPEPARQPSLVLTDSASIREAQQLLWVLGYDPGPADGIFGQKTTTAIRMFQRDSGLQMNGLVTEELLRRLRSRTDTAETGSTEAITKSAGAPQIQAGLYPAESDLQSGTARSLLKSSALSDKANIKKAQKLLSATGSYHGPVDGIPWQSTTNAIQQFQLNYGMHVDGLVTKELLRRLKIAYEVKITSDQLRTLQGQYQKKRTPESRKQYRKLQKKLQQHKVPKAPTSPATLSSRIGPSRLSFNENDYANLKAAIESQRNLVTCMNCKVAGVNLSDLDIPQLHVESSTFACSDFSKSVIGTVARVRTAGRVRNNDFSGANFSGAYLSGSSWRDNYFFNAILRDANLTGVDFTGSTFIGTDFTGADLTKANLSHTDLRNAILTGAKLCETIMPDGTVEYRGCTGTITRAVAREISRIPPKGRRSRLRARSPNLAWDGLVLSGARGGESQSVEWTIFGSPAYRSGFHLGDRILSRMEEREARTGRYPGKSLGTEIISVQRGTRIYQIRRKITPYDEAIQSASATDCSLPQGYRGQIVMKTDKNVKERRTDVLGATLVQFGDLSNRERLKLGLTNINFDERRSVIVSMQEESPFKKSGLEVGDVINSASPKQVLEQIDGLQRYSSPRNLKFAIYRDGKDLGWIEVPFDNTPADAQVSSRRQALISSGRRLSKQEAFLIKYKIGRPTKPTPLSAGNYKIIDSFGFDEPISEGSVALEKKTGNVSFFLNLSADSGFYKYKVEGKENPAGITGMITATSERDFLNQPVQISTFERKNYILAVANVLGTTPMTVWFILQSEDQ